MTQPKIVCLFSKKNIPELYFGISRGQFCVKTILTMNNEIYLYFDGASYDFDLLVPEGIPWTVEWGDGVCERHTGTGDWQWASHAFYANALQSIHIFTKNNGNITGLKSSIISIEGVLKKVNLSQCPSLMYFEHPNAEALDLTNNPLLKELRCEYGRFESLDLSGNPSLEKLELFFCKNLTALNLSKNTMLRELELTYTGVRKLGLNNRSVLQTVILDDDKLDDRSKKFLNQIVEQNGGTVKNKKWGGCEDYDD